MEASDLTWILKIPKPFSGGLILSYKCTNVCRHCLYASSPKWRGDWISIGDAERILSQLAEIMREIYPRGFNDVGVNVGLHFTGGEPFLNFNLLLGLVKSADRLGIPSIFVETNCFWCVDDSVTEERFLTLKDAGLRSVLLSVNPFVVEQIPFVRVERAIRIGEKVFGGRIMVYNPIFYDQFRRLGVEGTLPFKEYMARMKRVDPVSLRHGLSFYSILPMARAAYMLGYLYRKYPARHFFNLSCINDLTRNWHIHIDNYCNYIPGYCAGISLGDARDIDGICQGIDLDDHPVIGMLVSDGGIGKLYDFAVKEFGYRELEEGYISKCHLCVDIRRWIVQQTDEFRELKPVEFYLHLEESVEGSSTS